MSGNSGPVLTDNKRSGGIGAQDGFDYQVWNGLVHLPGCLSNDAFEGVIFEGFEDFEARFFSPHAPHEHFLDRFQAKSGSLSPSEVREVVAEFERFDAAHPYISRVHTLITPELPPSLAWLKRDLGRVRRARPFYAPFGELQRASDLALFQKLADEFGENAGGFTFQSVDFERRPGMSRTAAEASFSAAMHEAYPDLDVSSRKMGEAFAALVDLAGRQRGAMMTKAELLGVLSEKLGATLQDTALLRVHVRSDRNEDALGAIEINAAGFSGGSSGFPASDEWASNLLLPLDRIAAWARRLSYGRIRLSGSYRLTTGMATGWAFRSAVGFEIEILTRSGIWATDDRPLPGSMELPWSFMEAAKLVDHRLVATVGIIRDPASDVIAGQGLTSEANLFRAVLPQPITTAAELQSAVSTVKTKIAENAARLGAKGIDLFMAGPAAFSVALGHRWNALPSTQLYEFVAADRRYVPTLKLG